MNNVREYREKRGYTQSQIASILNITQASYSYKEAGKRGFEVSELLILEMVLDASISDMFKTVKDGIINNMNNQCKKV